MDYLYTKELSLGTKHNKQHGNGASKNDNTSKFSFSFDMEQILNYFVDEIYFFVIYDNDNLYHEKKDIRNDGEKLTTQS